MRTVSVLASPVSVLFKFVKSELSLGSEKVIVPLAGVPVEPEPVTFGKMFNFRSVDFVSKM